MSSYRLQYQEIRQDYKIEIYKQVPIEFRNKIHDYIKENCVQSVPILCCQLIVPYLYLFEGIPGLLKSIYQLLNKQKINQAETKLNYLTAILEDNTEWSMALSIFSRLSSIQFFFLFWFIHQLRYIYLENNKQLLYTFVDLIMDPSHEINNNMRSMIVDILIDIEDKSNQTGDDSILLQYNTHLHIFNMIKNKRSTIQMEVDGFNILSKMINNEETVKQLIKDRIVDFIEAQINEIYLSQLVNDKITNKYFLRLNIIISFILKLSNQKKFDMHAIITFTVTVKMIKIINQSHNYGLGLMETMLHTFLNFITNIFLYHQNYIDYLFSLIVNHNGALLNLLLNYVKSSLGGVGHQCLYVLNRGIYEHQQLIPGVIQYQNKIFIQQNMMHSIKHVLSKSIDKGYPEMITTIKHVFKSGAINYHLILDDDMLNFIINSLHMEKNDYPHYTELINSFQLMNIIFQTVDASDIIKRLFKFKQGLIIQKISTIYSNFQFFPQDYKHEFLMLFKYLKNIILMEYIEEKYFKEKFNEFDFIKSLIKGRMIVIDEHDTKIINNPLLSSYYIGEDFDSFIFDMVFLISLLTRQTLKSKNDYKDNHIVRIKPKIFDIILSNSSVEGCLKQDILNHELLSSELEDDIVITLDSMIDKCELFTTIDEEHYQIVIDEENECWNWYKMKIFCDF